jgi:hypothetical protein
MLVRKVDKAKWIKNNAIVVPPSADAITNDLKSTKNTLSVWYINNDSDDEVRDAVLAIVAGQPHLDTIDIVVLDDEYLQNTCRISIEATDGHTPISDLRQSHRDLSYLDFWTVGMVAEQIINSIRQNKIKRFRLAELKKLLVSAIEANRLCADDLSEDVRKKL